MCTAFQCVNFLFFQRPPFADGKIAQLQRAECISMQRDDFSVQGMHHPLDLVELSFADAQLQLISFMAADLGRHGDEIAEIDAALQLLQRSVFQRRIQPDRIPFAHMMTRREHLMRQLAVIGDQQQPGGVQIEPP